MTKHSPTLTTAAGYSPTARRPLDRQGPAGEGNPQGRSWLGLNSDNPLFHHTPVCSNGVRRFAEMYPAPDAPISLSPMTRGEGVRPLWWLSVIAAGVLLAMLSIALGIGDVAAAASKTDSEDRIEHLGIPACDGCHDLRMRVGKCEARLAELEAGK